MHRKEGRTKRNTENEVEEGSKEQSQNEIKDKTC